MRARKATPRRELLGAAALLLALAAWCPRTEGQGAPKQTAKDDLIVLRSVFPAKKPVTVRLRTVPAGQPEVLAGVHLVDVVDLLGSRFVRFKGEKGEKILLRSAQIYSIESGGSAWAPKVSKGSFTLSGPNSLEVKQGDKVEFKVNINRKDGFKEPVRISVEGLPTGIKVDPSERIAQAEDSVAAFTLVNFEAKDGDYEFTLRAAGGDVKAEARVKLRVFKK